jgi:hypothetical protein
MDRDQFFGNLFNEDSPTADAMRAQRQMAYEERTIKRVFSECGIKINGWGRLANACRDATGQQKMHFAWFNSTFSFPAQLAGRRIPKLHELGIVDLFKPPATNRLCKAVIKNLHRQEIDEIRPFVFVFPIVRKMYCAHNLESVIESGGVRWIGRAEKTVLAVEPTVSAFAAIGSDWWSGWWGG